MFTNCIYFSTMQLGGADMLQVEPVGAEQG